MVPRVGSNASNRDPYIIQLNIALQMVVSIILEETAKFQMGNMYLLRSPVKPAGLFQTNLAVGCLLGGRLSSRSALTFARCAGHLCVSFFLLGRRSTREVL